MYLEFTLASIPISDFLNHQISTVCTGKLMINCMSYGEISKMKVKKDGGRFLGYCLPISCLVSK
jgi:hypothetical protein